MKTIFCLIFALCVFGVNANSQEEKLPSEIPKDGIVPNEKTAIAIAVAVWTPLYGEKSLKTQKPYRAYLTNGVWFVRGTLPKGYKGGVAEAEIDRMTGCIKHVAHGR